MQKDMKKFHYRILRNKRPPPFFWTDLCRLVVSSKARKKIFCYFFHILPKYHQETSSIQAKIGDETCKRVFGKLPGGKHKQLIQ